MLECQGQWDNLSCQWEFLSLSASFPFTNKELCHFPLVIQPESLPPQPPVFIFIEVSPGKLAFWNIPNLSLFLFLLNSTPKLWEWR
jgi:hypothetical protein